MKKLSILIGLVILSLGLISQSDGQAKIWHQNIVKTEINLRGGAVVVGQLSATIPAAGKVVVHFDGLCTSTVGDRIILAASNTAMWGINDGSVGVEAASSDINRNSFSHTRVYTVSAGNHTFYAVAQNYVEMAGTGKASIYATLTVKYFPETADEPFVRHQGIVKMNLNVRGSAVVLTQQSITTTHPGYVLVRFDGSCSSSVGDRIALAASNFPGWLPNDGNVGVESVSSDVDRNSFSHTRRYLIPAGTFTYYAVAQNYVETTGSGQITVYGSLTVEFYPNLSGGPQVLHLGITKSNINVRGNQVIVGQLTLDAPWPGKALVHFDGSGYASVGDRIVLAASNNGDWSPNDGNVTVESPNTDVDFHPFSHTRVYDLSAGSRTFYAVSQNYAEMGGSGLTSIYASLTVEYFPLEVPDIAASPVSWDYGSVLLGNFADKTFAISNAGNATLNVTATTLTGANASQFAIQSGGGAFSLAPAASRDIVVRFNPTSAGSKSANLSLSSNDPDEDPLLVALTGLCTKPDISVAPPSVTVTLAAGHTTTQTLTINNTAGTAGLTFSIAEQPVVAWLAENPASGTIPAGGNQSITLTFSTMLMAPGTFSTDLKISSNDPDHPTVTVPVTLHVTGVIPPFVKIDPSSKEILMGKTGSVDVVIQEIHNLGGFEFEIDFNGALVHVENKADVDLGPFLTSTGRTPIVVGPNINNSAGTLVYGAASLGIQPGPNGTGVLATIKWKAMAEGTTTLDLKNVKVTDVNGTAMAVTMLDGEIKVKKSFWADVNGDGKVDILDIQLVAAHWNTHTGDPNYDPKYDVDNDGDIDIIDVQLVASWWNKPIPAQVTTPTPLAKSTLSTAVLRLKPAAGSDGSMIEVSIENVVALAGFQFDLTSPQPLLLKSTQLGEFLGQSGIHAIPLGPIGSKNNSTVTVGAYSYGEHAGVNGGGLLVRLELSQTQQIEVERVQLVDREGQSILLNSIVNECSLAPAPPQAFGLSANYPNPFNAETIIPYQLAHESQVLLRIFNELGQEIRQLVNAPQGPGNYIVRWNGKNEFGQDMAAGIYLYRLEDQISGYTETRKLLLLR